MKKKKRSDSLKCSVELEDSGLGLKAAPCLRAEHHNTADVHFIVSGPMTMTDMLAKPIEQDLGTKNSLKQISGISQQVKYLNMSFLQQDFPVKLFPLPANAKVFKTKQRELFSMKYAELLEVKDLNTYSLRMLKDYFLMTQEEPSRLYSFHWMNLGMMQNGKSLTLNITYHKTGKESLSSVLEEEVDEKYYLTKKAKQFLIKRNIENEIAKRGFKADIQNGNKISSTIDARYGALRNTGETLVIQCGHRTKGKPRYYKNQIPAMAQDYGTGGQNVPMILKERIRRLTPKECERLQGFPDDWTKEVSDTQRYKQMGNAVSVPVIEALGRSILKVISS